MRHVLVTGAAGFAGGYMVEELLARGVNVTGTFDRTPPPEHLEGIQWLRCDIRDDHAVERVVCSTKPDGIVHLAAMSVPVQANANPIAAYETNVMGSLHLLEAVRRAAHACRVLLISSCHVYGRQPVPDTGLCEELPPMPLDVYGATRAASETVAAVCRQQHGLDVVIARSFNHSGPRQEPKYFVATLAQQVARISLDLCPPEVHVGNLDVVRDFCDVRDVVRAYATLLAGGKTGQAYNVCSGTPVSLRRIVEMTRAISGCDFRVVHDVAKTRRVEVETMFGDPSLMRRTTGWATSIRIEDTLRSTLDYWKEACSATAPVLQATA